MNRNLLAFATFAFATISVPNLHAQLTSGFLVNVDNSSGGDALAGFITYDIVIDFQGQYSGSEMLLTLNSGEIYQDAVGSDISPSSALFAVAPSLQFDSFFANGSPTAGGPFGEPILVGPAVKLGGDDPNLADAPINQAWRPAAGQSITDQNSFLTARYSISHDTNGKLVYAATINDALSQRIVFPIINGVFVYPEPSSFTLVAIALVGLTGFRSLRKNQAPTPPRRLKTLPG